MEDPPPAEDGAVSMGEEALQVGVPARDMLPGLDASALEAAMPEEDRAAFADYLPILRGERTFRWVAGPYDGYECDWEPFDADMAAVRDKLSIGEPPEALTLDRLAVQDIDGDGGAELVLLFQDGAYNYLVIHQEKEAGYSTYHRMSFQDDHFEDQELGCSIDDAYACYRELDGREVTKEAFDLWLEENMVGDVTWYSPGGDVLPGGM